VRDFYFALQDLLRAASEVTDWQAERSSEDPKILFQQVLASTAGAPVTVFEYFDKGDFADWLGKAVQNGDAWRKGIRQMARGWGAFTSTQRFAVLQQVGSILRTSLTNDIESRLA
jgi:hypothetical protein